MSENHTPTMKENWTSTTEKENGKQTEGQTDQRRKNDSVNGYCSRTKLRPQKLGLANLSLYCVW